MDHRFKTLAFLRGGGIKDWPNLPTDSSKKTADGRGVGVKNHENLPTSYRVSHNEMSESKWF